MPKVSVLIAVYNAEAYLGQCLDSLIGQTMTDFEALCIDDCSTDSSLTILETYARKDGRLKIFRSDKNQGQAAARNICLEKAKGKYTCFLDSDDWLSPDALERAVDKFEHDDTLDCVLFRLMLHEDKTHHERVYGMKPFGRISGREAFRMSLSWRIHGVYMVRTSLHQRYPYDESALLYSDDNTTRIHYLQSRMVGECDGIYYYRQHPDSMTHVVTARHFLHMRANESMKAQLKAFRVGEEIMREYENVRWLVLVDCYWFYFRNRKHLSAEDCRFGINEIHRVWKTVEAAKIKRSLRYKFGYMPLHCSWNLFCLQEEIYFSIRKLLGRN